MASPEMPAAGLRRGPSAGSKRCAQRFQPRRDALKRFFQAAATIAVAALALCANGVLRGTTWNTPHGGLAFANEPTSDVVLKEPRQARDMEHRWPFPSAKRSHGGWHVCAPFEGVRCHCTGTVALHSFTADWAMLRRVNGSVMCTPTAFGGDPRPHYAKFCSCRQSLQWPLSVVDGINETIARRLMLRVEVGKAGSGCSVEDDDQWTPCAIMSTRADATIIADRYIPRLSSEEQRDTALRKLDECYDIGGPGRALRILGVKKATPDVAMQPVKAASAPVCAVVYQPVQGAAWESRDAVFCPTEPSNCLEGPCECADAAHSPVNVQESEDGPACWACMPPKKKAPAAKHAGGRESISDKPQKSKSSAQAAHPQRTVPGGLAVPQMSPAVAVSDRR